jgi:hypothetical protein
MQRKSESPKDFVARAESDAEKLVRKTIPQQRGAPRHDDADPQQLLEKAKKSLGNKGSKQRTKSKRARRG